jgi:hypothetical protein
MVSQAPAGPPPGGPPAGPPVGPPPVNPKLFVDTRAGPLPHKAVLLVAPITTFYIIALICIGLRVWAKRIKKTNLRFTDYAIFVAFTFATGYLGLCWLGKKALV